MKRGFEPTSLEDYMNSKPFAVSKKVASFPIQEDLFFQGRHEVTEHQLKTIIGRYFEILSRSFFGGTLFGQSNAPTENGHDFKPDVINSRKRLTIESKSVSRNESCKLSDYQIDQYLVQQTSSSNKIIFALYKYKIRHPIKQFRELNLNILENIVRVLSENIGYGIFLPFSVVSDLCDSKCNSTYRSRYDGERYDPSTKLSSKGMDAFLLSPEETLESICGSTKNYTITRTKTPKRMRMNGHILPEFPILYVEDRNYEKWLEEFKAEKKDEVDFLIREGRTKLDYRNLEKQREEGCSDDVDEEIFELEKEAGDIPF